VADTFSHISQKAGAFMSIFSLTSANGFVASSGRARSNAKAVTFRGDSLRETVRSHAILRPRDAIRDFSYAQNNPYTRADSRNAYGPSAGLQLRLSRLRLSSSAVLLRAGASLHSRRKGQTIYRADLLYAGSATVLQRAAEIRARSLFRTSAYRVTRTVFQIPTLARPGSSVLCAFSASRTCRR
jgi:hypothetical protein